jgi:hypothetical protein
MADFPFLLLRNLLDLRMEFGSRRYNSCAHMLPDLRIDDHLRLRKQHPCGSFEWTVVRLGADIGLECKGCRRRVMLTRRELAKRLKANLTKHEEDEQQKP